MKIKPSFFLSVIIVSIFNGRLLSIFTTADLEKSSFDKNSQAELVEKNNGEDSILAPDDFETNTIFFKETEKQELLLPTQTVIDTPTFPDNIEVSSELSTTAEAVVFPSAEKAVEQNNKVKEPFQHEKVNNSSNSIFSSFEGEKKEYIVHAEPKVQVQPVTEETFSEETNESEPVSVFSQEEHRKTAPQHEDIPSFSEWTQKQLAEAEKKKTDQNETTDRFPKMRGKFRNKNYASPDCGAKIVAANPESLSSSSVLSSLKDEYMLNYCTNRIWFVVELCEAIQAKQLDLANFELFSSSPKHFSVFVSHRFPTRDWNNVGKFTAQDSRDVQTFNLHPHLFGKYVKVELHSHYGREQFCPISYVGVYGTSEYEVLAKEDERHLLPEEDDGDPYDEEVFVGHRRDSPKNLFSSATDAVLSIVKKATAPFMKTENNETESNKSSSDEPGFKYVLCVSPRYIVVCNNCSQPFYDEVFEVLSCQHLSLSRLISNGFVKRTLIDTESCTTFGLDFNSLRTGAPFPTNFLKKQGKEVNYLTVMLKNYIIAALCNVLAVSENKVVVNATMEGIHTLKNVTNKREESCKENSSEPASMADSHTICGIRCSQSYTPRTSQTSQPSQTSQSHYTRSSIFTEIFKPSERFSEKIEPTKTLTEDEVRLLPPSIIYSDSTKKQILEEKSTESSPAGQVIPTATLTSGKDKGEFETSSMKEVKISLGGDTKTETEKEIEVDDKSNNVTSQDSTLESILSDINAIEKAVDSPSTSATHSTANLPTESIFLRLANRIKNLEINMSLSSTYLEELSKRYRTQLELLSKTLNLTIQRMEEHSKLGEEKERKREKEISLIRMQLANLTRDVSVLLKERNSWRSRASSISQHIFFISVEILLVWFIFNYRKKFDDTKNASERSESTRKINKKYKRRNSLEGVKGHETPKRKIRRPSDEALEIALSRNCNTESLGKMDKKRKRRKKESKCSISVIQLKKRKKSEALATDELSEKPASNLALEEAPKLDLVPNNAIEVDFSNRFSAVSSPNSHHPETTRSAGILTQDFPSPVFMKTALAARNSRSKVTIDRESSQEVFLDKPMVEPTKKETVKERKSSHSLKKYMKKFF